MNFADTLSSSVQNILTHPLRSIMTLLAIVIGIFAVVIMFSSVYGIKIVIRDNMEELGLNNSIRIYPDQPRAAGVDRTADTAPAFRPTPRQPKPLDYQDFLALKNHVRHRFLYGIIESWNSGSSFAGRERIRLVATTPDFFNSRRYQINEGRMFSRFEMNNSSKVAIIGTLLAEEYFSEVDVLGETIEIANNVFTVIGVIGEAPRDEASFDFNRWQINRHLNSVYVPLQTGITHFSTNKSVDYISIQSTDSESFREMMVRTRQILLANHSMSANFRFEDIGAFVAEITREIDEFVGKWNITLTAIASISLIVGGLGLFSTMLISIGERLKEIGIRKSVGASQFNIFSQYLFESILYALTGAVVGISLSSGVIYAASLILGFAFPVVIEGILLGFAFAVIIGILSGLYPAIKASTINPIQAIYYTE